MTARLVAGGDGVFEAVRTRTGGVARDMLQDGLAVREGVNAGDVDPLAG